MSEQDQTGLPGAAGEQGPENLEARVARLERELAALRQQMATGGAYADAAGAVTAAPEPPPPPPRLAAVPLEQPSERSQSIPIRAQWSQPESTASSRESLESLETRLGSQVFNRIAIVLLLIGTAYGMKLAVDRGLLGPAPRVILGLLAGAALVLWSERFRRKGFAVFSYSLKAVGSGVLYLTLWAAFQRFHLLPAAAAMAMMILVTAWNAYMAWAQASELLAVYALAGGLATPLLVSTGGNHEVFLFTYLLAIDLATVVLVRVKSWPRLLAGAFPATVVFFVAWAGQFYEASELAVTAIFAALFGAVFASVPVARPAARGESRMATVFEDILLPTMNAAFVALALCGIFEEADHHALLPWLVVALAAAYLALMQAPQTRVASAIHLSLAVVLLTIAIPMKASGAWITVSWLVEGLALVWVAGRLAQPPDSAATEDTGEQASRILRPLALGSLLLGFGGVCVHIVGWADFPGLPLVNKGTVTALIAIAVFALTAWLSLRGSTPAAGEIETGWAGAIGIAISAFLLIDLTAMLLALRELATSWNWPAAHPPLANADFLTAVIGLAVFACVVAASLRLAKERPGESFWTKCAAGSTIAFNLLAVLTGVREIAAIWSQTSMTEEQGLRQALAISAFLMLYGAALLAAGFWRRNSFLRWQALVLLVITILKAFLYDMRNLSQGYRVASLLALGSLLMGVSFAYQRDWLHLREPETKHDGAAQ